MSYRSLAIATLTVLLAACGPSDRADTSVPAAATLPTADPAAVATDPGYPLDDPSLDPGVPVDVSASALPDDGSTTAASPSPSPAESPLPSASPTATPTPVPTATPTPRPVLADLVSTVTSRAHNSVLLQHFTCQIQVKNDSTVPRTGKVSVTFVHDATPEDGSPPASQTVNVPAGGTANLTFTDPKFHPLSEDVAVFTTTDPYVEGTTPAAAVSFQAAVAPLLKQRCAGCHGTGQQGASNILLFTGGEIGYTAVSGGIARIVSEVQAGSMPKGGPVLSASEQATLEQWEAAGAPNN